LKRRWKKVAEIAWNEPASDKEIAEWLPSALLSEVDPKLLSVLRSQIVPDTDCLFPCDPPEALVNLENLRAIHPEGYWVAGIDSAMLSIRKGLFGEDVYLATISTMLKEIARRSFRAIEEHYLRKTNSEGSHFMRNRLRRANQILDYAELARIISKSRSRVPFKQRQQTISIDDGVPLT
jgi:hypothetical protein